MNGVIYFRADHELVGRVIAEKLRRRSDRTHLDDGFRVVPRGGAQFSANAA
jgi:hypothetical protein